MPLRVAAAVIGTLLAFVVPTAAGAAVSRDANGVVIYGPEAGATVGDSLVLGIDGANAVVESDHALTVGAGCAQNGGTRVDCPVGTSFLLNFGGFIDSVNTDNLTGPMTIVAHGGGGGDYLNG